MERIKGKVGKWDIFCAPHQYVTRARRAAIVHTRKIPSQYASARMGRSKFYAKEKPPVEVVHPGVLGSSVYLLQCQYIPS